MGKKDISADTNKTVHEKYISTYAESDESWKGYSDEDVTGAD